MIPSDARLFYSFCLRHLTPQRAGEEGPSLVEVARLGRPEAPVLFLASLCCAVSALIFMAQPYLIGLIIDDVTRLASDVNAGPNPPPPPHPPGRATLQLYALVLLALYAADALFHASQQILYVVAGPNRRIGIESLGERMSARLRSNLLRAFVAQDMAFFDERGVGDLMEELEGDTAAVQGGLTERLSSAITQVTGGGGCLWDGVVNVLDL
jgi:putative ABC transport system ATP-binding protein